MRTNVYYLVPAAPEAERIGRLSPALRLRLRLLAFWVRLGLTVAELRGVLRRFGRPEAEDASLPLEPATDLTPARRPLRPARVIDLAAARARLRS